MLTGRVPTRSALCRLSKLKRYAGALAPPVGPGGRQTHFCAIHSPKSVKSFTHMHKTQEFFRVLPLPLGVGPLESS